MAEETRYSAPALEKGLDILEFLAGRAMPCTKADIAEALNRTPSEIYRMLSVLEQRGYVRKVSGTASYSLSLKLFELSHLQSGVATLRQALRFPMEKLAAETGQACHFSIQHGSDLLVMMERMPPRQTCLAVGEGTSFQLTRTASGFVLLTQFDDPERHFPDLKPAERQAFLERIATIREHGHERCRSDLTPGVIDIAIPVGVAGTDLFGALAISQLGDDPEDPKITGNLDAMKTCARQINLNLGL